MQPPAPRGVHRTARGGPGEGEGHTRSGLGQVGAEPPPGLGSLSPEFTESRPGPDSQPGCSFPGSLHSPPPQPATGNPGCLPPHPSVFVEARGLPGRPRIFMAPGPAAPSVGLPVPTHLSPAPPSPVTAKPVPASVRPYCACRATSPGTGTMPGHSSPGPAPPPGRNRVCPGTPLSPSTGPAWGGAAGE